MKAEIIRHLICRCAIRLMLPVLVWCATGAHAAEVPIGEFSRGSLSGWEEKIFAGNTRYRIEQDAGRRVLGAFAEGTASGYFRKQTVDLRQTPYLHWSWRVMNTYEGNDERSKQGDDFPARIYVVVSGGMLFWRTRALNFVWSSNQAVGQAWPNPFTGNAMMVAVDSGTEGLGQWREHSVDIRKALIQYFDKDFDVIDAVAVMTDADNFGGRAQAFYGDIYFSDQ